MISFNICAYFFRENSTFTTPKIYICTIFITVIILIVKNNIETVKYLVKSLKAIPGK